MERVEIYNATLLRCISETNEISRSELEEKYLVPDPPGVVSGRNAMFDADFVNSAHTATLARTFSHGVTGL